MKSLVRFALLLCASGFPLCALSQESNPVSAFTLVRNNRIVVQVRRDGSEIEYKMNGEKYRKGDLNFVLGELKLQRGNNCQVIIIMEESALLADVSLVPKMAIDAGFTDIHAYVHFAKTGKIAELVFGPVRGFSNNPK